MVDLGTLGGLSSGAADINEAGQVVGVRDGERRPACVPVDGCRRHDRPRHPGRTRLEEPGGGINDAGQVVGLFNDNDDHAFYWTPENGMIELPTLSGIESAARAINNAGQLAGYGDIDTGDAHAVIWNRAANPPTPKEQISLWRHQSRIWWPAAVSNPARPMD